MRITTAREMTLDGLLPPHEGSLGVGGLMSARRPLGAVSQLALSSHGRSWVVWDFIPGDALELLVQHGLVKEIVSSYLDRRTTPRSRDAVANGRILWREVSELMFTGSLSAGSRRLPFWPLRTDATSDVSIGCNLMKVTCPYSGEDVMTVPGQRLDLAIVKGVAVSEDGYVLRHAEREFLDDADLLLMRAADKVIVEVEHVVRSAETNQLEAFASAIDVDLVLVRGSRGGS